MFIKSVHYILTFHIPQRMWEAWWGRPHYIFISLFFLFSFLVLCLALTFKKVRQTFLSPSNSEVPELSKIARDILG